MSAIYRLSYTFLLALLILGSLAVSPQPALAAAGVVGTGSPASCTEAAFDAVFFNLQNMGGGTITFNCGASPHIIIFSNQKPVSANTELQGADKITLSGGNSVSLFQVYTTKIMTLSHITLSHGYGTFSAGAVENFGTLNVINSQILNNTSTASAGGIGSYGSLTLTNSVVANNTAGDLGAGIYLIGGSATISGSQFTSNIATNGGSAIAASGGTSLTVTGSQFTGNQTSATFAEGGAVRSEGDMTLSQSTFSQNSASRGGALFVADGSSTVTFSTFSNNWAAYGGAIRQVAGTLTLDNAALTHNGYATNGTRVTTGGGAISWDGGTAIVKNVTISSNWASYGGGFDYGKSTTTFTNVTLTGNQAVGGGAFDQASGAITLINSTITGNSAPFFAGGAANRGGTLTLKNSLLSGNLNLDKNLKTNCYLAPTTSSFNLSSDYSCGLGVGRDNIPLPLGPLANNGGFTATHLLPPGSPAIDAGAGDVCPAFDQRGTQRPKGAACDIGAIEYIPAEFVVMVHVYIPNVAR